MNKHATFTVTEWEWLKVQLKIRELWSRAFIPGISFDIEDEEDVIVCSIHHNRLDEIFRETIDKEKLVEEYFSGWVEGEKTMIKEILKELPVLEKGFNTEKNIVFQIMRYYRKKNSIVCKIIGQKVEWNEIEIKEQIKNNPVSILEAKFLNQLKEFADYLRKTYTNTVIEVNSQGIGILSDWQGHCIDITCRFPGKPLNLPNEVVLSVHVFHLHSNPMLTANIEWQRTYFSYAPVSFAPVPFSQDALSRLEVALPGLCDVLEAAIGRGQPAFIK